MGRAAMGHPLLTSRMWWIPLFWFQSMCLAQFTPAQQDSGSSGSNSGKALEIVIPIAVVAILLVRFLVYLCKRSKPLKILRVSDEGLNISAPAVPGVQTIPNPVRDPDPLPPGYLQTLIATWGSRCTFFQYRALQKATENFSAHTVLGSGGFGTVYRGCLDDGRVVAIKKSKNAGTQDLDQFLNEVSILSQLNHINLVLLLGCCVEMEVPLLVYEFISNGTLQDHLEQARQGQITQLDWTRRLNIAIQTAEALKYLHVLARPPIFHRDVKSANILLDDRFNAKVADFGISKIVEEDRTHVSTGVKGTHGYLDPEYFGNRQLTDKSDVFSFGVVLLELITAQKPVDRSSSEPTHVSELCVPLIKENRVREIIDRTLCDSLTREDFESIEGVAKVAVACLGRTRNRRPSMTQVVGMLNRVGASNLRADAFYQDDELESEYLPTAASFLKYLRLSNSASNSSQAIELFGHRA